DVRAELNRETGTADIRLVTAGLVEQHTGENWEKVGLALSTLDPVPLFLPKLTRWTLAESRQEAPQPVKPKPVGGAFNNNEVDSRERSAEKKEGARDAKTVAHAAKEPEAQGAPAAAAPAQVAEESEPAPPPEAPPAADESGPVDGLAAKDSAPRKSLARR